MSTDIETARLLFDGQRLAQARTFSGKLKGELAKEIGVSPAAIGQFESGVAGPSAATLARLALAVGVPVGYFASDRERFSLREEDAHFRSLRSTSKRDRSRARAQVERLAEVVAALELQVRFPGPDLPQFAPDTAPETAARDLRKLWSLGDGPVRNMVGLLERKGVIVARLEVADVGVDAFSCRLGTRPYVILATNKDDAARSRFDAAHELGHLLLHEDASPGDPSVEREANRFAAEFLVPAHSISPMLPRRVDWRAFAGLKIEWRVSIQMLLFRARELKAISDAAYRRAMMEMSKRDWRKNEPASIGDPEQPELLGRAMGLLGARRAFTIERLATELRLGSEGLDPYHELLRPVEPLAV